MEQGKTVYHVDNPGRLGRTTGRIQKRGPFTFIEVEFGVGDRTYLRDIDVEEHEKDNGVLDLLGKGKFGRHGDLSRLLTFEKLRRDGDGQHLHNFFYSIEAARVEFHEYQYKPVLKFINSPTERIVLADEVGLGKTIEASLIWLEMQARYDAKRLLVVCPNMLANKWRRELREKFNVDAQIGRVENILESYQELKSQGDQTRFAWIATYSSLRPFRKDFQAIEEEGRASSSRAKLIQLLRDWGGEHGPDHYLFHLVICDEAHYMRNPASMASKLGALLANASQAMVLASATPVNNSNQDLLTLLRLADPDFFQDEELFRHLLEVNQPAVRAANLLNRSEDNFQEVVKALTDLKSSEFVGNSELLERAIQFISTANASDPRQVAEAMTWVEPLNILSSYISRTRRVQVKEKRPKRTPLIISVDLHLETEMRFYTQVTEWVRNRVAAAGEKFSAFHLVGPQMQMASCIPAVVDALKSGEFRSLRAQEDSEEDDSDDDTEFESQNGYGDLGAFNWIKTVDFEANDSKFAALETLMTSPETEGEKVIIFAFYKRSLAYVKRRLEAIGYKCALIHGDVDESDREAELQRFEHDPEVRVLISSEVGSEGIDLQFCRIVVNYDLPWNPMRIEQRIGRIDRVGQKADRLTIVHFRMANTIEDRLFARLHAKLQIFENSLGDCDAILGEQVHLLTHDLFSRNLTPAQEEERITQSCRAVENKLKMMQTLEVEGESLIAHSDIISSKIEESKNLGRYITSDELQLYVKDFFDNNFKGCVLKWDFPAIGYFELQLEFKAYDSLIEYARRERLESMLHVQNRSIVGTFSADNNLSVKLGSAPRRVTYLNHLSPLIRWITRENQNRSGSAYRASAITLMGKELQEGEFVYRVERWRFTGLKERQILAYGAINVESGDVLVHDEAERLVRAAVLHGDDWDSPNITSEKIVDLMERLQEVMNAKCATDFDKYSLENNNTLAIKTRQVIQHFERRLETDRRRKATAVGSGNRASFLRMIESTMRGLEEKRDARLRRLESGGTVNLNFDEIAGGVIRVVHN
jgi:superfamily II DNA or RNA helicase